MQIENRRLKIGTEALLFIYLFLFLIVGCASRRVPVERRMPPPEPPGIERRASKNVQVGVASWYGGEFHGRRTSSGEIYDMYQLTCAHNTLPLGTMVMVTNLENGKSVELKVNDRGPFVKERIIDLSYAAAQMIGMWEKGTAQVKVEPIGPVIEQVQRFTLQVGSFTEEIRAQNLADQLRKNFENVSVTTVETFTQKYHRVRIGPFETRESALPMAERLSQMGFHVLVTSR
jgi:rare lipoprotein A